MHRRPPEPPYPPSRVRSRSRSRDLESLRTRLQGVLAAHRRNTNTRRAGRRGQAGRRTRAIHRHILDCLVELLKSLLQIPGLADPGRRQLEVRRDQAQNRSDWLHSPANNFPEDKFTVLPDLREYLEQHHTWETVSVDSNSVNDPVELPPNISESESEEGTPYQRSDPILQRAVDRLVKSGQVVRTKKGIELSASSQEALARKDLSVPQLPERLRGGSRVAPSSQTAASSSTDPAPVLLRLAPKSVPKSAPKFLKPTPKSLPSTSSDSQTVVVVEEDTKLLLDHPALVASEVTFRNLSTEDLDRLQLQAHEGQCSVARARAVISWDHHQVLDTFRHSNRRVSRDSGGIYPRETQDVLRTVRQLPNIKIAQVVLSYCHLEDTVRKKSCVVHRINQSLLEPLSVANLRDHLATLLCCRNCFLLILRFITWTIHRRFSGRLTSSSRHIRSVRGKWLAFRFLAKGLLRGCRTTET